MSHNLSRQALRQQAAAALGKSLDDDATIGGPIQEAPFSGSALSMPANSWVAVQE